MAVPDSVIEVEDVEAAAARIAGYVRVTPVLRPGPGAFGSDLDLVLKLELFQHKGSFKPRGAFNRILANEVPPAGVIAASGGNHAAAVAHAASVLALPAEIHVPEAAPAIKLERLARYPVDVRRSGDLYDDAQVACDRRAAATRTTSPRCSPATGRWPASSRTRRRRSTRCSSPSVAVG